MNLKDIAQPVQNYMDIFNMRFADCATNEGFFVDDISQYVLSLSGKRLRPIMCFLSASIAGRVTSQTIRGALILELLHTASLIHDDVIDNSDTRRGKDSLKKRWGNTTAVLYGDYLYGKCMEVFETAEDFAFMPIFAEIGSQLPLGELLEKDVSDKKDYSQDSYIKVISKKTASLFEAAMEIGAKSATEDSETINALKNYGFYVGLAFQIRDDILDYSSQKETGKVFAKDILEKKITLPLIYLLESINDDAEKEKILSFVAQDEKNSEDVCALVKRISDEGCIDKAKDKVKDFCNMARIQIDMCDESGCKNSLLNLL